MRIVECYSHLNGLEYLRFHRPRIWDEIGEAVASVCAERLRTKISRERRKMGASLYSPREMNKAMEVAFQKKGWREARVSYWITGDPTVARQIMHLPQDEQRQRIESHGLTPLQSSNQTDFVKERVAMEVQFGKYSFVAFDLFIKHMAFYVNDAIDVGIEMLPMKELQENMSSGVGYYEKELYNLVRQGRNSPAVPLVLIGIAP